MQAKLTIDVCNSFIPKWFAILNDIGFTPEKSIINWNDFMDDEEMGIRGFLELNGEKIKNLGQLQANWNFSLEENGLTGKYVLTPQEFDFLFKIYVRRDASISEEIPLTCDLLTQLSNTPLEYVNEDFQFEATGAQDVFTDIAANTRNGGDLGESLNPPSNGMPVAIKDRKSVV